MKARDLVAALRAARSRAAAGAPPPASELSALRLYMARIRLRRLMGETYDAERQCSLRSDATLHSSARREMRGRPALFCVSS